MGCRRFERGPLVAVIRAVQAMFLWFLMPEVNSHHRSAHSGQNFLTGRNGNLGFSGTIQTVWSAAIGD